MVILLALGFVVARLDPELRTWSQVWTFIGEAMLVGGTTVTWIRSRVAGASAVFDRLGSLQASVERSIEDARNADRLTFEAERDRALRTEQEKKAQVEQARLEAEQAAEMERQAREAVREANSQARLGRFIRERTSSADYEKHLGLIAMIHRDFRRLSELMETVKTSGTDPGLPRIDRIILYIDDLDRCHPPEKVVRVLEAIHLLLFFPLFIVVVGVDSRWVSRALYKHYEGMLADEAIVPNDGQAVQRSPAQSQDFLEKIFHVPFWLRRMEPAGVQRMIHSLISGEEIETSPAAGPGATVSAVNQTVGPATRASGVEAGVRPGTIPEDPDRAAAKRVTGEAESGRDAIGESLAAPSESLRITAIELQFMDEVAPLMPRTPRSVKRFVNIYRLYKAALSPPAFARFLGTPERPGNFRAVQVLLALVTGTPHFASRVFQQLQDGGNSSARLSALVKSIPSVDGASLTTLQALREFAQGKNDMEIVTLREVSGLVSRYSLHHMVSSAPGESGLG
jgi:KAP family P-loop domain